MEGKESHRVPPPAPEEEKGGGRTGLGLSEGGGRNRLHAAVAAQILQPQAQCSLPVLSSEVEVDTAFFTCDQGCRSTQLASTYLGPQDVSGGGVCHIVCLVWQN